jgi:hypothetical protein
MVNQNSPTFRYSEKMGFVVGKIIRYIAVGTIITLIDKSLGGSKRAQPIPNSPGPAPLP